MPKDGNARFIYLIRDGRDVIVSFYNHLVHQEVEDGGYEGTLDEFVAEWLDGKIAFGKWTDHLKSWLRVSDVNSYSLRFHPAPVLSSR